METHIAFPRGETVKALLSMTKERVYGVANAYYNRARYAYLPATVSKRKNKNHLITCSLQ